MKRVQKSIVSMMLAFVLTLTLTIGMSTVSVSAESISVSNWAIDYADFCIATRMTHNKVKL